MGRDNSQLGRYTESAFSQFSPCSEKLYCADATKLNQSRLLLSGRRTTVELSWGACIQASLREYALILKTNLLHTPHYCAL